MERTCSLRFCDRRFCGMVAGDQISDKQCRNLIDEIERYSDFLRTMEHLTERIGIKSLTK